MLGLIPGSLMICQALQGMHAKQLESGLRQTYPMAPPDMVPKNTQLHQLSPCNFLVLS